MISRYALPIYPDCTIVQLHGPVAGCCVIFFSKEVVHCPGSECNHMWLLPKHLRRSKALQVRYAGLIIKGFYISRKNG